MGTNKEIYDTELELKWLEEKNIYKKLHKLNMHDGQPAILAYIYMHKNCTQYEIARYLGLSRPSIGVSVKRMEKQGFLTISPSETDKRSTCLNITKLGIKTLVESDRILNEYISKKYAGFSEEELSTYLKLLNKIKQNASKIYCENLEEELSDKK